jgi:hypothetical protein
MQGIMQASYIPGCKLDKYDYNIIKYCEENHNFSEVNDEKLSK